MNVNRIYVIFGVLFILVIGVVGYYWFLPEESTICSGQIGDLSIGVYAGDISALIYVADEKGFFVENGLDVFISEFNTGKQAFDALIDNQVDIATTGDSVMTSQSFIKPNIISFGSISSFQFSAMIARVDSGINTPQDLIGKKIGIALGTSAEFYNILFLSNNEISLDDVEIIDLSPSDSVDAIINNEIDAVLSWDPNIFNIKKQLGDNAISWNVQGIQKAYFILITDKQYLENNPEISKCFLNSLIFAENYVNLNPDIIVDILKVKFSLEEDYISHVIPKISFGVTLEQELLIGMEDRARWLIDNGFVDSIKVPNYLDFIELDYLDELKPEAVSIIHN